MINQDENAGNKMTYLFTWGLEALKIK